MRFGIMLSDSLFVQRLESTNRAWTYVHLAAKLSANNSEKIYASITRVRLITQANNLMPQILGKEPPNPTAGAKFSK
jgi:hypothetical protein